MSDGGGARRRPPGAEFTQEACRHSCATMPAVGGQLTIRGVSDELNRRLTRLSREQGRSVNVVARTILERAVGLHARREHLKRYATWTPADEAAFDQALAGQRVIDADLWR